MIVNCINDKTIEFNLPAQYKNIGLKISGGADSAIVAYMLAKYIAEERPDMTIIPITVTHAQKNYQVEFSKKVMDFIEKQFDIKFGQQYVSMAAGEDDYTETQNRLVDKLFADNTIDCLYMGLTRNPPMEVMMTFAPMVIEAGFPDRNHTKPKSQKISITRYAPLINMDKKEVAALFNQFDLIDTLFPLTRSCEDFVTEFNEHCKIRCFHCHERFWGFGRYE